MSDYPRGVDVGIVSWRCLPLLRRCLESLRTHAPDLPLRIVVVDNASRDGTVEAVRAEFPDIDLVEAPTNLGFAAATNIALRRTGSEFALVLNPDTEISSGALDRLVTILDEHPEVGIVGPRLVRPDGTFDHASRRAFPTPLGALAHFTRIGRSARAPRALAQYRAPDVEEGPVDAVNGAFMLIRRRALDEVGLFDEGYWMYMEDLDLSYRFKRSGWMTWYEPRVTVTHVKHGTTGETRNLRLAYAFHLGMYRFYKRHYARRRLSSAIVYAGIAFKFALSAGRAALVSYRARG